MEGDAVDGEDVVFENVAHQSRLVVVEDEIDGAAKDGQGRPSSITVTASRP